MGNVITCTRRLEFDAGHRLQRHESKCSHLHGHRYAVELTCAAELDAVGRVIDFGKVKELAGGWIDARLDHALILEDTDPLVQVLMPHEERMHVVDFSPTAENLARYIGDVVSLLLPPEIQLLRVRLYETPNGWADVERPRVAVRTIVTPPVVAPPPAECLHDFVWSHMLMGLKCAKCGTFREHRGSDA